MSRSSRHTLLLVIISVIVLTLAAITIPTLLPKNTLDTNVELGNKTFTARIAKTIQDREQGLSGVPHLASNQALLMVFPSSGEWEIWMKDMKIPLDIVWLNQHKQVVYIVKDALPKDSTKVIFSPTTNALYVIEIPAGAVANDSIKLGQTAAFETITQGVN